MPSLETFLSGYRGREQGMQAQNLAELQQAGALQKILAAAQQQDMMNSVMSGGGMGNMTDPDTMHSVGMRLSMAGHPGGAALIAQAEKLRKAASDKGMLTSMQGAEMPKGQADVLGVAPTDEAALAKVTEAAQQGKTATVAVDAKGGGMFDALAQSSIPSIANQAKMLQAQLNRADSRSTTPQYWMDRANQLAGQETKYLEAQTARDDRFASRPQSPLVPVIGPDGKPVMMTREDAIGRPPANTINSMANVIPPEHAGLHGEEYLRTLPPAMQNNVRAIAEGRQSLNMASTRTGNREALAAMVSQYSPAAFGGSYANKTAVQKDFTSGVTARNVTSANTVIAHIGTLDEMVEALKNKDLRAYNAVANRLGVELGRPEVNNFDIAKQAVGNELMRVFRQVNASEAETKEWESRFTSASSPEQLKGAIQTGVSLLKGRIDAIDDQWKRGMETDKGFPNLISPRSQTVLKRLGMTVGDAPAAPAASGAIPEFSDEAAAAAAGIKPGTRVKIGGKLGTWK